jgi:hypothetical protein
MAADIIKIDLTDVQDTLQATFQRDFELTTYADGSTITLASGTVEEVGGYLYRVEGGDLAITDGGVANGTVYVEISDDGDGTGTAELSTTAGTWDPNLRGYYKVTGEKTIFAMTKAAGPVYSNRGRLLAPLDQTRSIGQIFAIHPDTLILPNPFNFAPCDGVASFDTNFIDDGNDANVPDLTDDRFLMGDTTYGTGGADTHNHMWYYCENDYNAGSGDDLLGFHAFDSSGANKNFQNSVEGGFSDPVGTEFVMSETTTGGPAGSIKFLGGLTPTVDGTDHYYTDNADSKPLYFSVLYYIRIK